MSLPVMVDELPECSAACLDCGWTYADNIPRAGTLRLVRDMARGHARINGHRVRYTIVRTTVFDHSEAAYREKRKRHRPPGDS